MSSQRNSQKSKAEGSQRVRADDLTDEQMDAAVQNVTSFLLCDMRTKRKIRKDDVVSNALNKSSRQYAAIMKKVKDILLDVFGLKLAKISNSDDAFIIVNKHAKTFASLTLELSSERDLQDDLILTIVLASIFMNRGQMFESHLLTILETIGFMSDKFYGSSAYKSTDYVTKLVKNVLVKQLYLSTTVIPRPEHPQNPPLPEQDKKVTLYQWGFRALMEVDVDKVVEYLKQIHDDRHPAGFPMGYYKEFKLMQIAEQQRTHIF